MSSLEGVRIEVFQCNYTEVQGVGIEEFNISCSHSL